MSAERGPAARQRAYKEQFEAAQAALKDGRLDDAARGFNRALEIAPRSLNAMRHLGDTLFRQERHEEALACFRRVLDQRPDSAADLMNLGLVLRRLARHDEAAAAFDEAHAQAPGDSRILFNRALALRDAGRLEEADEAFGGTLEIEPEHHEAAVARAICLILRGRYEEGWPAYEARWCLKETPAQRFQERQWDGRPVNGPILLSTEQGLGDTIMFARFARTVRERATRVILESQAPLKELMRGVDGIDDVVTKGETIPPFARHAYLMSLPRILKLTPETIPAPVPYIPVDGERAAQAEAWLAALGPLLRVGFAWAGNPKHGRDRERSFPPRMGLELLAARGIALLSLQKGPAARQLAELGCGALISDLERRLVDFTDTAAIVSRLDLVVTCDSALAHLAGALGKPVWTALPFAPDWRWFLEREDTPWYPSMRLFRQPRPGDWESVFRRMGAELGRFAEARRSGTG